jgi:hypothetical protein
MLYSLELGISDAKGRLLQSDGLFVREAFWTEGSSDPSVGDRRIDSRPRRHSRHWAPVEGCAEAHRNGAVTAQGHRLLVSGSA